MTYIGIDLAWTTKNETGICVMDKAGKIIHLSAEIYSNNEILTIIRGYYQPPTVVTIDAPVVVPNETGSRPAERELASHLIHGHRVRAFHCSRSYLINHYGSIRAEEIAKSLVQELTFKVGYYPGEDCVLETFPTGILAGIVPKLAPFRYKIKSGVSTALAQDELFRLMENFSDYDLEKEVHFDKHARYTQKVHKHIEDQVDAFLCAYMAYQLSKPDVRPLIFGDYQKGFIILPFRMFKNERSKIT